MRGLGCSERLGSRERERDLSKGDGLSRETVTESERQEGESESAKCRESVSEVVGRVKRERVGVFLC